jgi:hypothetical protein
MGEDWCRESGLPDPSGQIHPIAETGAVGFVETDLELFGADCSWRVTATSSGVPITPSSAIIPPAVWAPTVLASPKPTPAVDRVAAADDRCKEEP